MSKNCWLYFNEDGYLTCRVNHYKPELCDLYKHEDEYQEEKDTEPDGIYPALRKRNNNGIQKYIF